jgi:hypothetical protein
LIEYLADPLQGMPNTPELPWQERLAVGYAWHIATAILNKHGDKNDAFVVMMRLAELVPSAVKHITEKDDG